MHLIHARGVEKSFGDRHILRGCDLSLQDGERIGLVGVNGSGKSTLLSILGGGLEADHGVVDLQGSVGWLTQVPELPGRTVREAVDEAVAWHQELLQRWERAVQEGDLATVAATQDRLDRDGWQLGHRVDAMMLTLDTPPGDARLDRLSGGEARRVALARVLLRQPEILLLDEPTNHLDADTCEWLQGLLAGWRGGVVLVTHDRYLLEAVATRILEIEDGQSVAYEGSYTDYLLTRAERRAQLQLAEDRRLHLIEQEAEWASRSPAARSVKQKARLQRLDALRAVRPIRREEEFHLDLRTGFQKGGALMELHGIDKRFGSRPILQGLDLVLRPGERVGIIGPNGAGKSTLLSILVGSLAPDRGRVERAPRLQVAILDQFRSGLDLEDTVMEAAGGGADHLTVGDRSVHVASFLSRFQFGREMLDQKVQKLSGGERARLLMAKLMLRGANLLLLDEPTNDLDLLTLQVLEAALLDFDGGVVVVTHDRAFLDRVCDRVLAFEGEGRVVEYASRQQHLQALEARKEAARRAEEASRPRLAAPPSPPPSKASPRKLSFKEQREHAELPERIEALEAEKARIDEVLGDPASYRPGSAVDVPALTARAQAIPGELDRLMDRWAELEERSG